MEGTTSNGSGDAGATVPDGDPLQRRAQRTSRRRIRAYEVAVHNEELATKAADDATGEAEFAEAEHEGELQSVDPDSKRRGRLDLAIIAASLIALLDVAPAWWAAEALGGGMWQTALVTLLLVAGLAGFAALLSHFEHERRRISLILAFIAAGLLVAIETGLRLDFLLTTRDDGLLRASIEAGLLALVTGGLLWMSYVVLRRAETVALYRMRLEKETLLREAKRRRTDASRATWQRGNEEIALEVVKYGPAHMLAELLRHLARDAGRRHTPAPGSPAGQNGDESSEVPAVMGGPNAPEPPGDSGEGPAEVGTRPPRADT